MSAGYVNIPGSLSFSKRGELVYYTYRRGLLRCSFRQGGQCEGLKVRDE